MYKIAVRRPLRKTAVKLRRWRRNLICADARITLVASGLLIAGVIWGGNTMYKHYQQPNLDPTVYQPLLATIAKGESRGNYNAYWGNASNTSIRFTDMSIGQVLAWQQAYVVQGSPSSAVGKYQIVRPTLAGLVQKLKIDPDTKFDENMQDRLAVALLEKRGAVEYMANKLSRDQFAANLAKEWAALPKATGPDPDQSYYAGDGVNKVQVSTAEVFQALATIRK